MTADIILATTDLSARGDRAIDRALRLGEDLERPVAVIHVAEEDESAQGGRKRAASVDAIRNVLPDPQADCMILSGSGPIPQAIAGAVAEYGAALVVTGVARFNSLGDYVLGTSVDRILRHSPVPVLVVKHRPHRAYRRMLCAVDLSAHSAHALVTAMALFPQAEMLAVHAYHVPFEGMVRDAHVREDAGRQAQAELLAFINALPLPDESRERLRYRAGYGDVGEVIGQEIEREDPDLVVFGTQGMGGFRQATIGSVAASLLEWVPPDTMVVPRGR